jgi:hypothetical protein
VRIRRLPRLALFAECLRGRDAPRGSDWLWLREKLGHEPLAFGDALDLDRNCVHSSFQPLEALRGFAILERRRGPGTASPRATTRKGKHNRRYRESGESTNDYSFRKLVALRLVARRLRYPDQIRGSGGELTPGHCDIVLELEDSLVEDGDPFQQTGTSARISGALELHGEIVPSIAHAGELV